QFDNRFAGLSPVKNHRVYNNNLKINANGGNDYWESGVVHPDLILSDLVKLLHADPRRDTLFHYYKKLN
ncbi:MAG: iron ABC transporter substrate-binding protein, partial [Marinilabiliales bacterium]|nr:iron ABC transporter substrate-binding protein [Marinilabiliales bacterium]